MKKIIYGWILALICVFNLYGQDSWTDSWRLIWDYSDSVIVADEVVEFDIYKGLDPDTSLLQLAESVNCDQREYRDSLIVPNMKYYYGIMAKDVEGLTSSFSNIATATIPHIMNTMNEIRLFGDTLINLNQYALDVDYQYSQYPDSLSWWVNDSSVYISSELRIEIVNDNALFYIISNNWSSQQVYFTVVDPDSFWYRKQAVVSFTSIPSIPSQIRIKVMN